MQASSCSHVFRFTGNGGEYFRIWIVNLALSVLTLGIYSAWAKVRRKRYFNTHTLLDGHAFDYLANPVAILKGRLLAVALFVAYSLLNNAYPLLGGAFALAFWLALPWIMVRAFQFNAVNTRYRGLRFGFRGGLGEAMRVYVLWPFLGVLSLGGLVPYGVYRKTAFAAGNHIYGAESFAYQARVADFYKLYSRVGVLLLLPLAFVAFFAWREMTEMRITGEPGAFADVATLINVSGILFVLWLVVAGGYIRARSARLLFAGMRLGALTFASRHRARELIGLSLGNLVLVLLTLGLYLPWAQIRMARYWLENLDVVAPEAGLDHFVAAVSDEVSARAAEMAETFDLDVSLA